MPVIRQKRSGKITKSGAITILPKNQIKEIDNKQGTIPVDLSINGHKLINTNIKFDDSFRNYNFGQQYEISNICEGLPEGDSYVNDIISSPNTIGTDSSFSKVANLSKVFFKDARQRDNTQVEFKPYKEENQIQINNSSDFYVSGTSPLVANNFQQSLQSRELISIPISGTNYSSILNFDDAIIATYYKQSVSTDVNLNFFSYYDFAENTWTRFKGYIDNVNDRTGSLTTDFSVSKNNLYTNLSKLSIPFSPSTWAKPSLTKDARFVSGSLSSPISNFGFPFSKKFKPFENNLLSMKNYINKPFFLEKVIFKCVLSHYSILIRDPSESNQRIPIPYTHGINLFLLNDKKIKSNRKINPIVNDTLETKYYVSATSKFSTADFTGEKDEESIRELVTYGKVLLTTTGSVTLPDDRSTASIENIKNQADLYAYVDSVSDTSSIELSREDIEVDIEVPIRTAFKDNITSYIHRNLNNAFYNEDDTVFVGNPYGGKTLLGKDLNKNYITNNENYSNILESKNENWLFGSSLLTDKLNLYESDSRSVPYILRPEDNLVLGFSSFTNLFYENDTYSLTFFKDNAELVLVGTPINDDKPRFEFDKRFLTSKNLRSGIIGDKFFTDRFDTAPIHLYASSSIDKIIESTGNRIIDRAVSGYYSNGNRGTHLKAVELQNSDISLTGSLLSEKAHFNYNSFGNFSDLYSQRKYTSYFKTGDNVVIYPVEKKFYDADGNKLHQTGTLSFNSDFNAKISTWFEES
jgi:hypothetical protein